MIIGDPKIGKLYSWSPLPFDDQMEIGWTRDDNKVIYIPVNAIFICLETKNNLWVFLYANQKFLLTQEETKFLFRITRKIKKLHDIYEKSKT